MGKISRSGPEMNIPDHILLYSENLQQLFDPGSGIRDGKKFESGINIPDPQH
jgi:hypothetical protein